MRYMNGFNTFFFMISGSASNLYCILHIQAGEKKFGIDLTDMSVHTYVNRLTYIYEQVEKKKSGEALKTPREGAGIRKKAH